MQNECLKKYEYWCKNAKDKDILIELEVMKGNNKEIEFSFYKDLRFGTAGIRGIMGAGTNKLNVYTIMQTARAVGEYMLLFYKNDNGITANSKKLFDNVNLFDSNKVKNVVQNKNNLKNQINNKNEKQKNKICECDESRVVNFVNDKCNLNEENLESTQKLSVVITYDSRHNSLKFAKITACVLCDLGINCYLTKDCAPTPYLSFLVQELNCQMGVNITSSHNPKEYNGFKLYNDFGCQIDNFVAQKIFEISKEINPFEMQVSKFDDNLQKQKIQYVISNYEEKYLDRVYKECLLSKGNNFINIVNDLQIDNSKNIKIDDSFENMESIALDSNTLENANLKEQDNINDNLQKYTKNHDLKIVYTALNGVGERFVSGILKRINIDNIIYVEEEKMPNGDFTTCPYPNPEKLESFALSIEYAKANNADLIIATDPDCDRLGVMVKSNKNNDYILLSGNEVGCILVEFILSTLKEKNELNFSPVIIRSIVTSPFVDEIVQNYGGEIIESLTGFKNIGAEIHKLEENRESERLIFAYEESCGYLKGSYIHDKDGVVATMLVCELARALKVKGKNLLDYLAFIKEKYGNYFNSTLIFRFDGVENEIKKQQILKNLHSFSPKEFAGEKVAKMIDYLKGEVAEKLRADVVKLTLQNDDEIIIRPSGTEPIIKCYITLKSGNFEEKMQKIKDALEKFFA